MLYLDHPLVFGQMRCGWFCVKFIGIYAICARYSRVVLELEMMTDVQTPAQDVRIANELQLSRSNGIILFQLIFGVELTTRLEQSTMPSLRFLWLSKKEQIRKK